MQFKTITDIEKEIARVQAAIDSTNNDFLRRDYGKYKRRLQRQARLLKFFRGRGE